MKRLVILIVVVLVVAGPITLLAAPKGQQEEGKPFSLFLYANSALGPYGDTYYLTPTTDSSIIITDIYVKPEGINVGSQGACSLHMHYYNTPVTPDQWWFEDYFYLGETFTLTMNNGIIAPIAANQTLFIRNALHPIQYDINCTIYVNGINYTDADFTKVAPTP